MFQEVRQKVRELDALIDRLPDQIADQVRLLRTLEPIERILRDLNREILLSIAAKMGIDERS